MLFLVKLGQPHSFADGTTITLKCLDIFYLSKCSNYNIVYTVKNEGIHLCGEGALL